MVYPKSKCLEFQRRIFSVYVNEEAQRAFAQQLYLSIIVLHDKFDYDKGDLKKYLSEMLETV